MRGGGDAGNNPTASCNRFASTVSPKLVCSACNTPGARSPTRAQPHTLLAQPRESSVFDGGFGKYGSVRGSRRNLRPKSRVL